ncbi:MAG TPA: ATP-dependent DNA helicase RecQ [Bacteroidales bacterium]|nr:ATP-dependent DNA helicase RecQ [Bacteroidales bacterium]
MTIQQILTKYWGYSSFRPMQEDIINSVLAGNDTLALMPTGGGKSLCYQVPAMVSEGLCIVVSPLIALMKDQVENLKRRGIKAIAIYSGMSQYEIDIAFDNAVFDKEVKLLYLSPERLITSLFRAKLKRMKVNLLAVDEAHCISQWGYDFRPPYLQIAEIREYIPDVPILALTATATREVVDDIQNNLKFRKNNLFQVSFERKNLSYFVKKDENKLHLLLKIADKNKGSGIVYVRNRKKTKIISDFLNKNQVSADFYHAGLEPDLRDKRQTAWQKNEKRVMVCTNAFGMGIDKPDVRFVVHLDLPDCIEAYFQEAGRAGRDEKKAFAVLLYENADILDAYKNFENSFPDKKIIRKVYTCLGNYYQLAVGSGADTTYVFNINEFCDQYNLQPVIAYNSIKFLEKEGYVYLSDSFNDASKVHFIPDNKALYRFQLANPRYDPFIKLLLRLYSGLFNDFVKIEENEIARKMNTGTETVVKTLDELVRQDVLFYEARSSLPKLTFTCERLDDRGLILSDDNYGEIRHKALIRLEAMTEYVASKTKCRCQYLLEYFGEKNSKRCGTCDICLKRNELGLTEFEFDSIVEIIRPLLTEKPMTTEEILSEVTDPPNEDHLIKVLRWLVDNDKIDVNKEGKYRWS